MPPCALSRPAGGKVGGLHFQVVGGLLKRDAGSGRVLKEEHPDDLVARGLVDGQRVRVSSRVGAIEVEVLGSAEMMPGVVSLPHGWGHARPGVQMAIATAQPGSSANDLTDERHLDELSGNAALNGVPVTVAAA